jgi:hypothetical protein
MWVSIERDATCTKPKRVLRRSVDWVLENFVTNPRSKDVERSRLRKKARH